MILCGNTTPMTRYCFALLLSQLFSCDNSNHAVTTTLPPNQLNTINDIPAPTGFEREVQPDHSFGKWLRQISLKKDKQVYLHDGRLKSNQSAQYAVLNISVGKKDLQQCADAIMRLRAEYLMSINKADSISFLATNGQTLAYAEWRRGTRYKLSRNRIVHYINEIKKGEEDRDFMEYMDFVFTYCGTLSLYRQLKPVSDIKNIKPGDIWIKPGSPGHAMIVVDVATDKSGNKHFMLAQSYMPAQDIHVTINPANNDQNPWYSTSVAEELVTPEWIFSSKALYTW